MTAKTPLRICLIVTTCALILLGAGRSAAQEDPLVLVYGQAVEGEITSVTPTQRYAFDAQANDVVTIAMTTTSQELDPFVALTDVQGVQLATDDDSGGETNARLAFVIPAAGRYLIVASHAGGLLPSAAGGRYTLSLSAVGEDGVIVTRTPLIEATPTPDSARLPDAPPDQQGLSTRLLPITPSIAVEDELTRQVAFRLYWFKGEAGDQIAVTAPATESFAPLLSLYNAQFAEVMRAAPGEPLNAQLAETGVYLISVSLPEAGSAGGRYTLTLATSAAALSGEVESFTPAESGAAPALPPDFEGLTVIAPGSTVSGALDDQHPLDLYIFSGAAGQPVEIEMRSLNPQALNGLDPFLVLLDDGRIPLDEHDDIVAGVERDARIAFTLPQTGYYAIVATRFDQEAGTSAGPYELTLSLTPGGPAASAATPPLESALLRPNTPVQAVFDGAPDVYRFDAQAGELIDLSATADSGVDPVLILATGTLREIVSSGTGALTGLRTPAAGTYYLLVATRFGPVGATGGYILALNQPEQAGIISADATPEPPLPDADRLAYGQALSGVIDDQTPSRIYRFSGVAGERVRLTLRAASGSTLDPYLELRAADGTVLDANDDIDPGIIRDSQIVMTLPADGEYQALVSRYVGPDTEISSGAYELIVEPVEGDEPGPAPANIAITPLSYGQTQVGEITNDHYLLFYVFTGAAGDRVTIEIDQLSGNVDAILHLYQAAGQSWTQIAYNDDSPAGGTYDPLLSDFTLPASSTYLIAVGRYGLDKDTNMLGTFSITLTRQP